MTCERELPWYGRVLMFFLAALSLAAPPFGLLAVIAIGLLLFVYKLIREALWHWRVRRRALR
jgi:hypothetical protein